MIKVERVYKAFEDPVLRGVNLTVGKGRLVGLVGPPACGKSVLLRTIAGLVDADAGSILVGSKQVVHSSYHQKRALQGQIGMLFQNVALFDFMSVGENLAFPLLRLGVTDQGQIRDRVAFELSEVGLEGFEDRAPTELSGGQKRRVGLARAAIPRPPVLLYDEPAAGLDPVTTSRTFALLERQRQRLGSTVLTVSSDIDRLLPVVDEVAVMHRGRVVVQGPERVVRQVNDPMVRQFLSGSDDGPL